LRELMALTSGTKLGPYEIQSPLGAGGMGEVYRARDTRLGRDVAVKALPSHLSSNPDLKARFECEAKAISALSDPLTVEGTIIGTFQYMAPEQVQGHDADARSDLFALGAVLYEMMTGKRAFSGKSQVSVMSAILEKDNFRLAC